MKREIMDNNLGGFFLIPQRIFAFVILNLVAASLFSLNVAGIIAGILLVLCACAVILSQSGIQIDIPNYRYKYYIDLFQLCKLGSWKTLVGYQYTLVKRSNHGYRVSSLSAQNITVNQIRFDVYLVKRDRRTKILINSLKNKELALGYANEITEVLDMNYLQLPPNGTKFRHRKR